MSVTLILGGARSGKSRRAEALARDHEGPVVYLATGPDLPDDEDWQARVAEHRRHRPEGWRTVEVPTALADALATESAPGTLLLVDCLTLWLSNCMIAEQSLPDAMDLLQARLREVRGPVILVSNEVGSGVHPATESGRSFRDAQGLLNQRVAEVADRVELLVAGLPIVAKGGG